MKKYRFCQVLLVLLSLLVVTPLPVQAARGIPGSPEFGYGAWLDPSSKTAPAAMQAASDLHLDWLAVNVSWTELQPKATAAPNWSRLDALMSFAEKNNIAVMASLSNAPGWAITPQGPDAAKSAAFAAALVQHYPKAIQAVELFPAANTRSGWGAQPKPEAYLAVYKTVLSQINQSNPQIILVAGGLKAAPALADKKDIPDLDFLRGLYDAGAANLVKVFSLQIEGIPLDTLAPTSSKQTIVLRHYEDARKVMVDKGHSTSQIWITRVSLSADTSAKDQAAFLNKAYPQVRSQLYIGTAFLQNLNVLANTKTARQTTLIQPDGSKHSFYNQLRDLIAHNSPDQAGQKSVAQTSP